MNSQLKSQDLLCFSHLRWNFVFQRPQHLMSRFAKDRRVLFIEEPVREADVQPHIRRKVCDRTGVQVLTPVLRHEDGEHSAALIKQLLQKCLQRMRVASPIAWFYSPMWLDSFPQSLAPSAVIYDCMDELSMFKGAPARLHVNEMELLRMANLVFTGGVSLYEYKRALHPNIFPFPSGVDVTHFAQRIDLALIHETARLRPQWNFIYIGPVVKIDPASLPQAPNIHWLGMQDYQNLPSFFAGWDVAIMPFAINDATRFISPTKTPEFLSAGLQVVSTPIRDVVRPYGDLGLARIASTPDEFVGACDQAMAFKMGMKWRERADVFLETLSWDSVWSSMNVLLEELIDARKSRCDAAYQSIPGEAARV
jgi:UDP-galactopyranose mutase